MKLQPTASARADDEPFTIHLLNTYGNMMFQLFADELEMKPDQMKQLSLGMHGAVVEKLAEAGIQYKGLRNALSPQRGRKEIAFIFDAKPAGGQYGYEISKLWLPVLRKNGPKKTAIMHGDMVGPHHELVHRGLERYLVGPEDFPRRPSEMYYVVYFTNLSGGQLVSMDEGLKNEHGPYLGYIDCSTWNPLKPWMPLPQFGLRIEDLIVASESEGYVNQTGFPIENYGFKAFGVEESLYDVLLRFRIDQGIPEWAVEDGAFSLNVLSGTGEPFLELDVVIDESRVKYLSENHEQSFVGAGLAGLDPEGVATAIKEKIRNGLIYNLRFIEGSSAGVPDPALNAHMFTIQLDKPDTAGVVRRYQIGMKYFVDTHVAEVVTLI